MLYDFLEDLQANPDNFPRGQVNAPSRLYFFRIVDEVRG